MKVLALVIVAAVATAFLWLRAPDAGWKPGEGRPAAPATAEQVELGRYLVTAGDCIACHTAQGGIPFAGARPIPTPYGAIYSTNLTPDVDTGLGAWNEDDFWGALHFGRSRDGRRLYPAFPYTNYTRVTREDADAMFAYLRSLPPARQAQPAAELRFPYDTQLALRVWRALYFRPGALAQDPSRTASWNRGAYLVEGLGHCDACHTERTWLGGLRAARAYAGGPIPMLGWDALPLTSREPMTDAHAAEMAQLLKAGASERGVMTGPMAEVVFRSLQHLDDADIAAMVEYLRALPHREPARRAPLPVPAKLRAEMMTAGAAVYREQCVDCHGEAGEGVAWKYPALAGNALVTSPSPSNAIETVLYGGYGPSTATVPMPYGMPPYAERLTREQVAAVLTYVRGSWGNDAPAVSPTAAQRH